MVSRVLLVGMVMAGVACGARAPGTSTPAPLSAADEAAIAAGDSLYHTTNCIRCHGIDQQGTTNGPSLRTGIWRQSNGSIDDIARVITTGVARSQMSNATYRQPMPPRGGSALTNQQVRQLAAYVHFISRR